MTDFNLTSEYSPAGGQPKTIEALVSNLDNDVSNQVLLGVTGSGKTFTIANVIEKVKKPTIILSHNKTLAAQLYSEFKLLFPNNAVEFFISYYDYYQPEAYLPVTDTYIEKDSSINDEIDKLRIKATTSLVSREDVIIIASVSSIYGIGSPKEYKKQLIKLSKGKTVKQKELLKSLISIHYLRNDMVLEPGNFRVRGDIVDIFPLYEENPIRIDFFGDEIDNICQFDFLTGEIIIDGINEQYIFPSKHFVVSQDVMNDGIVNIRKELNLRLKELRSDGNLLEAQRLEQRTLYDIEMMMELGYCSGIENYSRHLDGRIEGQRPFCLLDFFPDDFLMVIDESHVTIPQIKAMYNGDRSRKLTLVEHGFRLPSALDNRPMKFEEFIKKINQTIYVSATPAEYELELSKKYIAEQIIRPTGLLDPVIEFYKTKGQIDCLIENIKITIKNKEKVLVTTLTKRMSEDLTEYLKSTGIRAEYLHSEIDTIKRTEIIQGLRSDHFDVLVGINLLREGLDLPEVSLVAVLDADKQGFLRSKSSLMQVSGRAARNINGKVILFGDSISEAMKYLIDETNRRRKIQNDYNIKNNISPKTISKSLETTKNLFVSNADNQKDKIDISEINGDFDTMELKDLLKKYERKMLNYAKDLRFEEAALIRDKIDKLKINNLKG
ncbi:MAG: excinuclease ABC subunit B [Candidatus Marinimicrobia bacterium]|nr:excinuclease ABC subunit B [Candidatus Neomarinimicrobiota bacterium]|tara:strand:+ start:652 stop:2646 length:1995 start_codon:yes stop_codon:yes gene_type:complete